MIGDQKITIKPELPEFLKEYGRHIWISPDKNDGVILAISSLSHRDPVQGTIEFYRVMQENGSFSQYVAYRLSTEVQVSDEFAFTSATFVEGDFVWRPTRVDAP